jgi:hypothetical protein
VILYDVSCHSTDTENFNNAVYVDPSNLGFFPDISKSASSAARFLPAGVVAIWGLAMRTCELECSTWIQSYPTGTFWSHGRSLVPRCFTVGDLEAPAIGVWEDDAVPCLGGVGTNKSAIPFMTALLASVVLGAMSS